MVALHLPLYQFHQTIEVPFYCMLMDFGGFGMVSSKNVLGVRVNEIKIALNQQPYDAMGQ